MTLHRTMALLAGFPVLLALFFGDIPHYDRVIKHGQMSVVELAQRLRNRDPLLLIDLRSAAAIDEYTLPGAISIGEAVSRIEPESLIVIYGYEQSPDWIALHERGYSLRFVVDAVNQWTQVIAQPRLYRGSSLEEQAQFEKRASLSRYFGGAPRIVDSPVAELPPARPRRGCGF